MARAQWGGGGDYSSVFAGMANQEQNLLENAAQSGVARAKADSEAHAAEVYNDWKNGKISDDEWLTFLRGKVAESAGDPEEHQRWSDALKDHEGAILDSQMEANYSLGKLSLAGLMAHYSRQMKNVETNSPKWRDYAARYAQIQNAVRSGGGSGGGGGSRSGGGGSSRGISAGQAVLGQAHPEGLAYDVNGEDVIRPANTFIGYSDGEDYINNLFSDVRRIDTLMDQLKADPGATVLHDPYTSWDIPVNADVISELDRQYLRTEDQMIAYHEALGTSDGFEAAQKARSAKQTYINGPMMQHNTDRIQPVYDALAQSTAESVAAIGDMPDPMARISAYKDIAKQWAAFEDGTLAGMGGRGIQQAYMGTINIPHGVQAAEGGNASAGGPVHWTEQLPEEMKASGEMFKQAEAWKNFMTAAGDPSADPTQRSLMIDSFLDAVTGREGQPDKADLLKMIEGDDGTDSGRAITGILETHDQYNGIVYADDPNYAGPRYVYVNDDNGMHLVRAEVREIPHDGGNVTAQLVPEGVDTSGLVQTITRVGGRTTTVWNEPTPVNDPRFIAYKIAKAGAFGGLKEGSYLSSDWIANNGGMRKLNQLVASGALTRESQVQAVDLPDGSRWFIDPETRLASRQPPALAEQDTTTGGILVGSDGKIDLHYGTSAGSVLMPFYGMGRKDAQAYVSRSVREGTIIPTDWGYRNEAGEVTDGPAAGEWDDTSVDGMYWSKADDAHFAQMEGTIAMKRKYGGSRSDAAVEARRRGQANDSFVRSNVVERTTTPSFGDILRDPFSAIKRFAAKAGIDMSDGQEKEPAIPHGRQPFDFLPADDAVFGVHQAQAEMRKAKTSMLAPALPSQAILDVPTPQRTNIPVPEAPKVAPIATGRTYTAERERDTPTPIRPAPVAVNVPGRYHGKRLPTG